MNGYPSSKFYPRIALEVPGPGLIGVFFIQYVWLITMYFSLCSIMWNVGLTNDTKQWHRIRIMEFQLTGNHCLLSSSFRWTWKKTSNRPYMRGIHRRWNRVTLDQQSPTPVIAWDGNPLVTSGFTAHRASNVINYRMTNYKTVTWYEFHEFSTHLHLHCLFNRSFGQTS